MGIFDRKEPEITTEDDVYSVETDATPEDVVETIVKVVEIVKESKKEKKEVKKAKSAKVEKQVAKTDAELVREFAQGKSYNLKNPQTYKAILKIVKGN